MFRMLIKHVKFLLLGAAVLSLAACATPTTPAPVIPTPMPVSCSVKIVGNNGMGMSQVLGKLGINYYSEDPFVLLIDGAVGSKSHMPQPGEVFSLATPPAGCVGDVNIAWQVHFNDQKVKVTELEINGFDKPIDTTKLEAGFEQTCKFIRSSAFGLSFDGDLVNGGCNYAVGVKTSYADGTNQCKTYDTFVDARDAVHASPDLKWIAFYSEGTIVEGQTPNYCK